MNTDKTFSHPKVTTTMAPGIKTRLKHLKLLASQVKNREYKDKAQNLVKLYEDRKAVNFVSVANALTAMSNQATITSGRALREYNKLQARYKEALPATGRLERERGFKRRTTCTLPPSSSSNMSTTGTMSLLRRNQPSMSQPNARKIRRR